MKTAEIERFTESAVVLKGGERLECDVCILAYRGLLVGGIPNDFHPMGSWHSVWTQRLEPVMGLAVGIMRHMKQRGYGAVSIERRDLDAAPGITPNYVMRSLSTMPRCHGTSNLPSIDNLFAVRFDASRFQFL